MKQNGCCNLWRAVRKEEPAVCHLSLLIEKVRVKNICYLLFAICYSTTAHKRSRHAAGWARLSGRFLVVIERIGPGHLRSRLGWAQIQGLRGRMGWLACRVLERNEPMRTRPLKARTRSTARSYNKSDRDPYSHGYRPADPFQR